MLKTSFAHKVCNSRAGEGTRIWLEGARLLASGFTHKSLVARIWSNGRLTMRLIDQAIFDALARAERSTIAGTPSRPILDITGAAVKAAFPSGQVMVSWSHDSIVIEGI